MAPLYLFAAPRPAPPRIFKIEYNVQILNIQEKSKGKPAVSIIIRAKNEERWIGRCLRMIYRQDFKDFEVILVDNRSTDHTVAIARKFPVKVVPIDVYRPGKAINDGVQASSGRFLACLSAHCIPKDGRWLSQLVRNMDDPSIAGVYGRQMPMSYSSDLDKRDLLLTFGLDRRVQVKDSFFHNANSLIRRSVWDKIPFDDKATNIEDRIWGEAVIKSGAKLAYEPDAAVYHYHGIHQDLDRKRAGAIVRIMETLDGLQEHRVAPMGFDPSSMRVMAIVPVLGKVERVAGVDLLARCLTQLKTAKFIDAVTVIAEDAQALKTARRLGASALVRPRALLGPKVGTEAVLRYALKACETGDKFFDAGFYVNYLYPFRPKGFFDRMIEEFARTGVDSLVPTLQEYQPIWTDRDGELVRCDSGLGPRATKEPVRRGLIGLGCVTSSELLRQGRILGDDVGLVPLDSPLYAVRVRDAFSRLVAALALKKGESSFGAKR